jgi:hypothetical protein
MRTEIVQEIFLSGLGMAVLTGTHQNHLPASTNRLAVRATVHCLTGCAIGEVLGMVLGTALRWPNWVTVAVSVALAFVFGYSLTLLPLRRAGLAWTRALSLAFAADTLSIALMEIVDNVIMLVVPGAMEAPLDSLLFWGALAGSLVLAGVAAFPLNRWLILRGRGHAVVHAVHGLDTDSGKKGSAPEQSASRHRHH